MTTNLKTSQILIQKYARILNDLRKLGIIRTENSPIGDYAEYLVATKYKLKLLTSSWKEVDAEDLRGIKYQIKSRRIKDLKKPIQFGVIRNLLKADFKYLICVVFDENFNLLVVAKLSKKVVIEKTKSRYSNHQAGHILTIKLAELLKYKWKTL